MPASHVVRTQWLSSALILLLYSAPAPAQPNARAVNTRPHEAASPRDGQHDFDWDIGTWRIHIRRLLHPLTGSTTWVEYNGTNVVRKVWDGRANLGEVEADGAPGHLELLTLRLYNPQAHQWSMNITSSAAGVLGPPSIGEFANGHAEFVDQESYDGRLILVRFDVSVITPSSCRFEQAFSADAGKTWEVELDRHRNAGEGLAHPNGLVRPSALNCPGVSRSARHETVSAQSVLERVIVFAHPNGAVARRPEVLDHELITRTVPHFGPTFVAAPRINPTLWSSDADDNGSVSLAMTIVRREYCNHRAANPQYDAQRSACVAHA